MGDPETVPEVENPEPEIPGVPIGDRKPEATPQPITDPEIPELQDRRRPRP
jgi:hypothetical protein